MEVLEAKAARSCVRRWIHRLGILLIALSAGSVALTLTSDQAWAQRGSERTLHIQNDTVYVDGAAVPDDELPPELSLDGVQMQYEVYGIEAPMLQIQGRIYRLTESTLELVDSAPDARNTDAHDTEARNDRTNPAAASDYMAMLQAQSQALYEAVQREYALEQEAEQRAYRIHELEPGSERAAHLDTLRQTVARLFDLKQANRNHEIMQLEKQVEAMRQRMQERAVHREAMIERRMQQLVNAYSTEEP